MTYSKTLSPYQEQTIFPITEKLKNLSEGESLELRVSDPKRIKYLLYTYLHINNLKEIYKIFHLGQILKIQRLIPARIFELKEKKFSEAEAYIFKNNLLLIDSQTELEAHLSKVPLEPSLKVEIIQSWIENH